MPVLSESVRIKGMKCPLEEHRFTTNNYRSTDIDRFTTNNYRVIGALGQETYIRDRQESVAASGPRKLH